MKPSQKPEWLEPNDDVTSHRKVSRGAPVFALVAAVTLIGVGAIFAQPQAPSVVSAEGSVAVLNTAQQASTVATPLIDIPLVETESTEDTYFEDLYDDDDFDEGDDDDFDEGDDDDFEDLYDDDFDEGDDD